MTAPREPRGLLSNTLASAAATFWVAALTVVSVPILIRLLGVSEYGVWILITVLAVQGRGLGSLLDLGLSQSVIQRVAATDDPDGAGGHVGAGVRLLAAVGVVAAAVIVACAPALVDAFSITTAQAAAVTAVRLLGLQLVVELPAVALGAGLEGLRRYEVKRAIDAGRATAFAVGAIVIAAGGGTVAGLALWSVVTTAATATSFVVALRHFGVHPFRGGSARAEARAGMPLLALRATGVGYRQLDRVVLGLVVSTVAVAGFDVAEKVNLVALTALGAATSALIPAAAFGLRTDRDRTRGLAVRATRWSAAVTVPLAAFAFGAAAPLAHLVAGTDIAGATAAIRWLALATVVSVVFAATFEMAIGAAAARRLVPVSLGGLALNIVATIVLARRYGLAGSAAATCVTAIAVLPVVARICGEVFDHSTAVLVRACVPGFGLGLAVAACAAAAVAILPGIPGLALGASVATLVVLAGLLGSIVTRRDPAIAHRRGGGHVMRTDPQFAAVIPVRSGSKRIADKNLAEVGGRPLLTRAVHTALAAFGTVVVSTDSERYAAVARRPVPSSPSSVPVRSQPTMPRRTPSSPMRSVGGRRPRPWSWCRPPARSRPQTISEPLSLRSTSISTRGARCSLGRATGARLRTRRRARRRASAGSRSLRPALTGPSGALAPDGWGVRRSGRPGPGGRCVAGAALRDRPGSRRASARHRRAGRPRTSTGTRPMSAVDPYLIAEIGVNHDGDTERALAMVRTAAAAGFDAVKFQYWIVDELLAAEAPNAAYQGQGDQRDLLAKLALDLDALRTLRTACRGLDLDFVCTADGVRAHADVMSLDPDALKVGSGDNDNPWLLEAVAASALPVYVSTGMSDAAEVVATLAPPRRGGLGDGAPLRHGVPHAARRCPPRTDSGAAGGDRTTGRILGPHDRVRRRGRRGSRSVPPSSRSTSPGSRPTRSGRRAAPTTQPRCPSTTPAVGCRCSVTWRRASTSVRSLRRNTPTAPWCARACTPRRTCPPVIGSDPTISPRSGRWPTRCPPASAISSSAVG